jgi:Ulp1 family protease
MRLFVSFWCSCTANLQYSTIFCTGKDIFNLNKVFVPINIDNCHWICGVIYVQKKRIQLYDSLFISSSEDLQQGEYLKALFRYLRDDHQDKKGTPLPDQDEWELVQSVRETPQQKNCASLHC